MSLSPTASPSSSDRHGSSGDINAGDIPWDCVERGLSKWLEALRSATSCGEPEQVLALLEGLVNFICCNDGSFLHTIVSGHSIQRELKERGAPDSLIITFTEVIQCTGGKDGAILSFGSDSGMPQHLAAELIQNMQQAQRSMSPSSPGGRSSSPRRLNCLPQRTTQDMLDQIWHDSAAGPGARTACSNSLQISNLANTTVVSVDDLSPAVLSGLECDDAVPFLILRWLNAHLVEAIFCIHHADTTFVLKRKVLYVGPKPETQLEGQLALEGTSLPWGDVAGLLTAPADTLQ